MIKRELFQKKYGFEKSFYEITDFINRAWCRAEILKTINQTKSFVINKNQIHRN